MVAISTRIWWLVCLVLSWNPKPCQGGPVMLPNFEGRYRDTSEFNVLLGTNATFNYTTYPFDTIYRLVFDKVISGTLNYLGDCIPSDTAIPCDRTIERVTFVDPLDNPPYIVLSDVTKDDSGQYRTRVFKDKVPTNPSFIDIETTVNVYQAEDLTVTVDVTNVENEFLITVDQSSFRPNSSIIVQPDQEYTWRVRLKGLSPMASISLVQWSGSSSRNLECRPNAHECSGKITFSNNQSSDWKVSAQIDFNTQNVPIIYAEFQVQPAEKEPKISELAIALPLVVIVILAGGLIILLWKLHDRRSAMIEHNKQIRIKLLNEEVPSLLQECIVSTDNLDVAEYIYEIKLPSGGDYETKDSQIYYVQFIVLLTALMNTSGGIITYVTEPGHGKVKELWAKQLIKYAKGFIGPHRVDQYVKRESKNGLLKFYVKYFHEITYIDDGISSEQTERTTTSQDRSVINDVLQKSVDGQIFLDEKNLFWCSLVEKIGIFSLDDELRVVENIRRMKLTSEGGDIIIGTDGERWPGLVLDENKTKNVELQLSKIFQNNFNDTGSDFRYYFCKKFDIWENSITPINKYIVQVHIYGTSERRLYRYPTAYGVEYDGRVEMIDINEVTRRTKLCELDTATDTNINVLQNDAIHYVSENKPSEKEPLINKHGHAAETFPNPKYDFGKNLDRDSSVDPTWYRDPEMEESTAKALKHQILSWKENTSAWKNYNKSSNTKSEITMERSLESRSPITFIPPKVVICSLVDKRNELSFWLDHMQKTIPVGYLIAFNDGLFVDDNSPKHTLEDLRFLLVSKDSNIHVFSFGDRTSCLLSARKLKKKLVALLEEECFQIITQQSEKFYLAIKTSIVHADIEQPVGDMPCHKTSIPEAVLNKVFFKFAVLSDAVVIHRLGDSRTYKLTEEQIKILTNLNKPFNFIEGPPGSGKSVLSLTLYRKLNKRSTLMAAPTRMFLKYCESQGVQNTHLLLTGEDVTELKNIINPYDTFILDDVQHMELSEDEWNGLFEAICNDENQVYLFGDSEYHDYKHKSGTTCVRDIMKKFCTKHNLEFAQESLNDILRNTTTVCSFMDSNIQREEDKDNLACSHGVQGDDVIVVPVPDYKDGSDSNGVLQIIKSLLGYDVSEAVYKHDVKYAPADISVLVDGDQTEDDVGFFIELLQKYLPDNVTTHRALVFPVRGIVVETLDNFCGLDSRVIIFVLGDTSDPQKTLNNDRYKIYVASRGISLVIFVQQTKLMSTKISDTLHFDKLDDVVINHFASWNTSADDIPTILKVVECSNSKDHVLRALSAITAKYGEEAVSVTFVVSGGIQVALNCISKNASEKIRERSLITLTMVALNPETRNKLLTPDVIPTVCLLLSCEQSNWKSIETDYNVIVNKIENTILDWDLTIVCGVAHGDIDYRTYKEWLSSSIRVQKHMALWSMCNLIKTDPHRYCSDVVKKVGLDAIRSSVTSGKNPQLGRLKTDILSTLNKLKIIPGAFVRDY